MKLQRYTLIVLISIAGIVPVVAQEKQPSLPTAATLMVDGPNGIEYASAAGRFKIQFPGMPQEFETPYDLKPGQFVTHFVTLATDVTHTVNYTDYPTNMEKPDVVKKFLDNARDVALLRVAKDGPRILSETDVSMDGHPGRLLRVELRGDALIRSKLVVVGSRVYVLSVTTPKRAAGQREYEKLATTFFDSFKLISPLEADLGATWKEFSFPELKFKIKFPATPYQVPVELAKQFMFQVIGYQSAVSYTARHLELPKTVINPAALKALLDSVRDAELEYIEQRGRKAKILSETDITYDRYPGRMLVLELLNNVIYRNKTIVVNNRLYILTAIIPKLEAESADGKAYDQLVTRFFDSFSLLPEPQ